MKKFTILGLIVWRMAEIINDAGILKAKAALKESLDNGGLIMSGRLLI